MQAQVEPSQYSKEELLELYRGAQSEIDQLKDQLAELRRLIYGSRSERYIPQNNDQLALFQQEASAQEEAPEEQVSYSRKKNTPKRKPVRMALPADLPRETEVIEPEGLSENARRIGCEVTETLEYIPPRFVVHRIERPRYIDHNKPVIAELPSLPLPRSNAGASVLAHIAVSKLVDHLPFYRQLNMYQRVGIHLSKSTIGGWFSQTATLLEPLYDTLCKEVLRSDYLQMDESPIGVQDTRKKESLHQGYQWVVHDPIRRLVLFRYDPSRSGKIPKKLLGDFSGTLQTDGYTGYQQFENAESSITPLGCLAHGRRYFEKALKNDPDRADHALKEIRKLYGIECKAKERGCSNETIRRYRSLCARPILREMKKWMKEQLQQVLPKSAIGTALAYNLKRWENISRYTQQGRYRIDNNLIENTIRPMALGRKNYLFAGSHKAAQNLAMFYSFFGTCKTQGVEPLHWLNEVLLRINETPVNKLHTLLPKRMED